MSNEIKPGIVETNIDAFNMGYGLGRKSGIEQGETTMRQAIIERLDNYYELTQFSEKQEGAEPNPEWDAGFMAALSIVIGDQE